MTECLTRNGEAVQAASSIGVCPTRPVAQFGSDRVEYIIGTVVWITINLLVTLLLAASPRQPQLGLSAINKLPSSLATVAADRVKLLPCTSPRDSDRRSLPFVGEWPVALFSTQCTRR